MTSQGQRFRRRALRRGYKVDEVDVFLDRVEATLNNERQESPVRSEEVRDVVFRVRFGGYDEWQVDLHLDRVERQLAEQEPSVPPEGARLAERLPERMPSGAPGMGGPGMGGPGMGAPGMGGGPVMGGAPMGGQPPMGSGFDRGPGDRPPIGVSQRDLPPRGEMPRDPRDQPPHDDRMMPPLPNRPPMGPGGPPTGPVGPPMGQGGQPMGGQPTGNQPPPGWPEQSGPPQRPGFPNFPGDRAPNDRPLPERQPGAQLPERTGFGDGGRGPYDNNEPTFSGFEAGRRARPDMTGEMRLPDVGPGAGGMQPPTGPANQPPMGQPPMGQPQQMNQPPMGPPPGASGEAQRIDQLRRTFQPRRFGSGYDRAEVDRLFDGVIGAMSGRGSINEAELDPQQFSLVPGGYFESEVDQALREVRDIIRRR